MTDKYKELRAAMDAEPTHGPWKVDKELGARNWLISLDAGDKGRGIGIAETRSGVTVSKEIANAQLIAAANPVTIRALLAERDDLREALVDLTSANDHVEYARALARAHAELAQSRL